MKQLSNSEITIQISNYGAELNSIQHNGHEYLWQADPKFWQRHSPVLFPIVGSVWNNEYRTNGRKYMLTQHGFARDMNFFLVSEDENEVHFQLTDSEETLRKYPFHFLLDIGYRLEGKKISVLWRVVNIGKSEMHFQIGAHPAFYYPNFKQKSTAYGYLKFDKTDGLNRIQITEKGCANTSKAFPLELEDGLLALDAHTFDHDALILQDGQVNEITLLDNDKRPYIALNFKTPVVGLWSPPSKNAPFVCIEPWYGRCDSVGYDGEFCDKEYMQHLAPETVFHGGYDIIIL